MGTQDSSDRKTNIRTSSGNAIAQGLPKPSFTPFEMSLKQRETSSLVAITCTSGRQSPRHEARLFP